MGEALLRMGGGGGPVEGILAIVPYSGTGSAVLMREFATSISVSDKVKQNFSESTHPFGTTRSMQTTKPSSSVDDGKINAKSPTWEG